MAFVGPAASVAARLYIHDLERAYRPGREVYDPDYALATDPDAYDVVQRDPETSHAIRQRKHLVAGSRWRVMPASDEDAERRAAAVVERLLGKIRQFSLARFHLADSVFRGSAWAIVEGRHVRMRIGKGAPARTWWVPTRLRSVDKRRFRQFVADDGSVGWEFYSLARHAYEPLGDRRRWFVRVAYDDTEDTLGYGRGLMEAIYHWQYAKTKVMQDGLAGFERWCMGILKAKIDGLRPGSTTKDNEAAISAWMNALDTMRSRHQLVHGEGDELDLIEASGSGHSMAKDFLGYFTTGLRVLILGSNLPTSATSGGSYALAEVQENSTETLVDFDRDLMGEALSDDLVSLTWAMNREALSAEGLDEAELPTFRVVSSIRRDMGSTSTAIGALVNAGVRGIREDEAFDALGLTPAGPFDRELRVVAPAGAGVAEAPAEAPAAEPDEQPAPL